ncbi:hypothetical protein D6C00_00020 [Thiohalobacter thiocyanaticus]|uniref:Uncharacterized protein n=2 Tax=Thiohalobacter thiocyanaticus TaxID=585455 RepID=A0A426QFH3_9GAMM|nr:hypothetical protein D6C00_00020 [Thiohalobacter thiocyanaticus]
MVVVIDGQPQLEYDRSKSLPGHQQSALDRMDAKMDQGIELPTGHLDAPNALQRAQFVALQLVQAVREGNEAMAAATCAYLALRVPELQQVSAEHKPVGLHLDLIFDRPFMNEMKIEFFDPSKSH